MVRLHDTDEKIGRQLNLMETEQRPWMEITGIYPASDFIFNASGAATSFDFKAINVGKTVALNVYPSFQLYVFINQKLPRRVSDQVSSIAGETCQPDTMPISSLDIAGEAIFPTQEFPDKRKYVASIERSEIDAAFEEHKKDNSSGQFTMFVAVCVDYRIATARYKTGMHYALMEQAEPNKWQYLTAPITAAQSKTVRKGDWQLQRVPNGFAR
jgi:hypothetical protein